jgi:gluconolactonase
MRITSILFLATVVAGGCMARAQEVDLSKLIAPGALVQKLAGGLQFIEGPVWTDADGGYLVFSDIPASELKKWDGKQLSTFRELTREINGNTRDREGRLISCVHAARCVLRTENDGSLNVLVKSFEGKAFNSPNDVVVKSDGSIWFTDPSYGLPKGEKKELDGQFVFRFDPASSTLTKVATDFEMPNGLCFSPDEKKLYIADSGKPHHIRVFDVQADHTLKGGDVFCVIDKGVPDGIRCDEHGNVWSSAGDGVQAFNPDGKLLDRIIVPESPANLCFGGADGKTLFMTARTSLYSIQTLVRGVKTTK